MTTTTEPAAMRTVTTLIRRHGEDIARVQVPAEPTTSEHLVIAPTVDETGRWRGSWMLLHVPTGLAVLAGRSIDELRDLADRVAVLDWSFADRTAVPPGLIEAAREAIRAVALTEPSGVELPAHDAWGPDGKGKGLPRTALPMIRDFLADYQHSYDRTMYKDGEEPAVPSTVPGSGTPEKPRGDINPEWNFLILRQVHAYGLAYLLAALHRTDPEVADSAAAALADAWEAGDSLGEWAWQWGQELAAGKPLTLPGIPRPDVDVWPAQ